MVTERKEIRTKGFLWLVAPYFLSAVLAVLYAVRISPKLGILEVNISCLILFFFELSLGLIARNNRKKGMLLLAAVFIGMTTAGLNVWENNGTIALLSPYTLSGWSMIWLLLLFIAVISALAVMIRIFRWTQEQWEEIKRLKQEDRLRDKNYSATYDAYAKEHRLKMLQKRHEYEENEADNKIKNLSNEPVVEQEETIEQDQNNGNNQNNDSKNKEIDWKYFLRVIGLSCVIIAIFAAFILIPLTEQLIHAVTGWLDSVKELAEKLKGTQVESGQDAFLYYFFFYVVVVSVAAAIIYIVIQNVFMGEKKKDTNGNKFLELYQTPLAVLIVSLSTLFSFLQGDLSLEHVTGSWHTVFIAILFILLLFAAVEIVRLVLVQCLTPDSLLRNLIYCIFVVVIKFFSEIILGVVVNLRIKLLIDSLFSVVFTESNNAEDTFERQLDEKLYTLFHRALLKKDKSEPESVFRRRKVWRRRKK